MKRWIVQFVLVAVVGIGLALLMRAGQKGTGHVVQEVRQVFGGASEVSTANANNESADPDRAPAGEIQGAASGAAEWLTDFTLTERSGKDVSSRELKGQPYLVSFFFSTCPSICVMQNQALQKLHDEFRGKPVKFVSISVDPETDTPEVLREYALRFGADPEQWWFLTGDLAYIRRVAAEMYALAADKGFHSEKFVLVDYEGKVVDRFSWREAKDLQRLKDQIRDQMKAAEGTAG